MDPAGTRYLVVDYINYRLNNNGVQWDQCPALLPQPLEVHLTLRKKETSSKRGSNRSF